MNGQLSTALLDRLEQLESGLVVYRPTAAGEGAELGGLAIDKRVFVQSQKPGTNDRLQTFLKPFC
jgi:hypothetical protein